MFISLRCLSHLLLVKPILEVDVELLDNEFVNGCREGDKVLYVSSFDKNGTNMDNGNVKT